MFAGHEVGAENWALLASIVATCKLNRVDPVAYIAATLQAILDGHPQSRIAAAPASCARSPAAPRSGTPWRRYRG